MQTDIEIAQQAVLKPIQEIAQGIDLTESDWEPYGHTKAKLSNHLLDSLKDRPYGKIVLVTSINPTPAGEGKLTVTVGLRQALNKIGEKAVIALREPSLGPVMGMKGGAAVGAIRKFFQWRISIFTLQEIFMRLQVQTMHFLRY